MGAAAIFELWQASEGHRNVPAWGGLALAGIILLMLPAMLVAAGGAVFSTPLRPNSVGGLKDWVAHYRVFVASLAMAAIAAYTYTALHFSLVP